MTCANRLDVQLTYAALVDANSVNFSPAISDDGTLAWSVFSSQDTTQAYPAARLWSNNNGQLTQILAINQQQTLPPSWVVADGSPNPSWTLFSLVEANPAGNSVRITIYNSAGAQVATRTISGVTASDFNVYGGQWSPDGQFLTIQYSPLGSTTVTNTDILAYPSLATVASYAVTGQVQETHWFLLPSNNNSNANQALLPYYLLIANAPTSAGSYATSGCPNYLTVLRFDHTASQTGTLVLVDQVQTPSFVLGCAAWPRNFSQNQFAQCKGQRVAFLAGTTIVDVAQGAVSPFLPAVDDQTAVGPSCIGADESEVRLYGFDGSHIVLAAAQNSNLRGYGITFSPTAQYLYAIQRAFDPLTSNEANSILEILRVPIQAINAYYNRTNGAVATTSAAYAPLDVILVRGGFPIATLAVSLNSQWLLAVGPDAGTGVYPLQLYRIV